MGWNLPHGAFLNKEVAVSQAEWLDREPADVRVNAARQHGSSPMMACIANSACRDPKGLRAQITNSAQVDQFRLSAPAQVLI